MPVWAYCRKTLVDVRLVEVARQKRPVIDSPYTRSVYVTGRTYGRVRACFYTTLEDRMNGPLKLSIHQFAQEELGRWMHICRNCQLCVLVEDVRGCPRLRSASTRRIQLPRVRTSTGQRSFAFHGPSVWNSSPSTLRHSSLSLRAFKGRIRTYPFGRWTTTNTIRRC